MCEEWAIELIEQCDTPVVYWLDSNYPRNGRHLHPQQNNQFWITVKAGTSEAEKHRLIITGLYISRQETLRGWRIGYDVVYRAKLFKQNNLLRIQLYRSFLDFLNSFVLSLDAECYVARRGIYTEEKVLEEKTAFLIEELKEYSRRSKKKQNWPKEVQIQKLIEYGNICRRNDPNRELILALAEKINRSWRAKIETVENIILNMIDAHDGTNGNALSETSMRALIQLFKLQDMVRLYIPNAFSGNHPLPDGRVAPVYSFIPSNYRNQLEMRKWFRYSRECIATIRHENGFNSPDVIINIIKDESLNAFADGNSVNGFFLSFTTGLIEAVHRFAEAFKPSYDYSGIVSTRQEYVKHLIRQTVFFITAHEYVHVLNGDTDINNSNESLEERMERENRTDQIAESLLHKLTIYFYRMQPVVDNMPSSLGASNQVIIAWAQSLSPEQQLAIRKEMNLFTKKVKRDIIIRSDAITMVDALRAKYAIMR